MIGQCLAQQQADACLLCCGALLVRVVLDASLGLEAAREQHVLGLLGFSVLTPWHARQVSKAADMANQIAAEAIAAIRTVAAFSMEAELALQFRLELDKPWKKFVETALVTGVAYGSSFCVIFLVSAFLCTLFCATHFL